VGLIPVEVWKDGRTVHFGNAITKVTPTVETEAEGGVQPAAEPLEDTRTDEEILVELGWNKRDIKKMTPEDRKLAIQLQREEFQQGGPGEPQGARATVIEDEEAYPDVGSIFSPTEDALAQVSSEPIGYEGEARILPHAVTEWQRQKGLTDDAVVEEEARRRRAIEDDYPEYAGRTDLTIDQILKRVRDDPKKAEAIFDQHQPLDTNEQESPAELFDRLVRILDVADQEDISYPGKRGELTKGRVTNRTSNWTMWLADVARTVRGLEKNLNDQRIYAQYLGNEAAIRDVDAEGNPDFSLLRGSFGARGATRSGGVSGQATDIEGIAAPEQAVTAEQAADIEAQREEAPGEERGEAMARAQPSSRRPINLDQNYMWVTNEETGKTKRVRSPVDEGHNVKFTQEEAAAALATLSQAEARGESHARLRPTPAEGSERTVGGRRGGRGHMAKGGEKSTQRKISREKLAAVMPEGYKPQPTKTAEAIAKSKAKEKTGTTRLYRAQVKAKKDLPEWLQQGLEQSGVKDAMGRWFVKDRSMLDWYVKDQAPSGSDIVWVDVPNSELDDYRVVNNPEAAKFSRDPENEFFLPARLAKQAKAEPKPKPPTKAEQAKAVSAARKEAQEQRRTEQATAKAQRAERRTGKEAVWAPKETHEERRARIFAEIAAHAAKSTDSKISYSGNVSRTNIPPDDKAAARQLENNEKYAHAHGWVNFYGNWIKPIEQLSLREAVDRMTSKLIRGTAHDDLVGKLLEMAARTHPDLQVYVLEGRDFITATGDPKTSTKADGFYAWPERAGNPQEGVGFIGLLASSWNHGITAPNLLAHEAIHPVTHEMLRVFPALEKQLDQLINYIKVEHGKFSTHEAPYAPARDKFYGLVDAKELLSEITNYNFAELLHSVQIPRSMAKAMGLEGWRKATAWNGIVAAIRKFFNRMLEMAGLDPVSDFTALDAVLSTIERASHTYDPSALGEYQAKALRSGAMADADFANVESQFRRARENIRNQWLSQPASRSEISYREINSEINSASAMAIARSYAGKAATDAPNILRNIGLRLRSRDSIMRGYEKFFPEGMLRRVVNSVARRETLGKKLNAEDAALLIEREKTFAKHAKFAEAYENSRLDQTNWQIDPSVPLERNTWLYNKEGDLHLKGQVSATKYAQIKRDYDKLPEDMRRLMRKEFKFYKDKYHRAMDGILANSVLAASKDRTLRSDERMTFDAAVKLGRRIVNGEATTADIEKVGDKAYRRIRATPEFAMLAGPYAPMMRYGDYIVSAKVNVADPTSGKWRKSPQSDNQHYIVDFYGDNAEREAVKFATKVGNANREEYAEVSTVWTNAEGYASKGGEPYTKMDTDAQKSYRVTVQDNHVEFFETESEATAAAEKLAKDKYYKLVKPVNLKADGGESFAQAAAGSRQLQAILSELKERDALEGLDPKVKREALAAIQQAVFRAAPGTSVGKHRLQRRHVAGASKEGMRAMHGYSNQMNSYIAGIETADEIHRAFTEAQATLGSNYESDDRITPQAVLNELSKRRNARAGLYDENRGGPVVNFLTSWQFVDKLASPAYSIINMTQMGMVTMPQLAARHGVFNAGRALTTAMKDIGLTGLGRAGIDETIKATFGRLDQAMSYHDFITKGNKALTGNRVKMLDKLVEYGALDPDAGFEATTKGQFKPLKWLEDMWRQYPRAVEATNRYATALAAYDLAIKKGDIHDKAVEYARDMVESTQFNYSAGNASPVFNHPVGRVVLQFMKFGASMYQLLAANTYKVFAPGSGATKAERLEAARGLMYLTAAHVIMAGFGGLPLEPVRLLVTGLSMVGVPIKWEDVEDKVREIAVGMVGEDAAEAVAKGLPRWIAGVDVSTRLNMTDLLLPRPQMDLSERGGVEAYLLQFGGPTVGNITEIIEGAQHLANGEVVQATEKMIPFKMLSDTAKAVRFGTEGKLSQARDPVLEYGPLEMFWRSMGFRPAQEANISEFRAAVSRDTGYIEEARRQIMLDYYSADPNQRGKFGPRLKEFNKDLPYDQWITPSKLNKYVREKVKGQSKAKNTVIQGNEHVIDRWLETFGTFGQ